MQPDQISNTRFPCHALRGAGARPANPRRRINRATNAARSFLDTSAIRHVSSPDAVAGGAPVIHYATPYATDKNIGIAYNRFMSMLPDGDFACFTDGDTLWTTSDYGHQIAAIVQEHHDCRLFYAMTNRIHPGWQRPAGAPTSDDVAEHRRFGAQLAQQFGTSVTEVQNRHIPGSGFLILLRKSVWTEIGGFATAGMLKVDWDFFRRAARSGEKILRMNGVYLYHWYRGGAGGTSHLTPAAERPSKPNPFPAVFYHVAAMNPGHWQNVVREQLTEYARSGMDAPVTAGLNGTEADARELMAIASDAGVALHIEARDENMAAHERTTIKLVQAWARCADPREIALYFHTKGVSHPKDNFAAQWRRYMTHYLIAGWRTAFSALDHFDVIGCNWRKSFRARHYSGNFWMARCGYLRKLPPVERFYQRWGRDCRNREKRIACEMWIGAGKPNAANLGPAFDLHFCDNGYFEIWSQLREQRLTRMDLLNGLIHLYGYRSYLEIGVYVGECFNAIRLPSGAKTGVDPHPRLPGVRAMTSDTFFATEAQKYDLVFIDGSHHAPQVYKDIVNSLACLNSGGAIVLHDLLPSTRLMQRVPRRTDIWTGNGWKAWMKLRSTRTDLFMEVVDADFGCGIIRRGRQLPVKVDCALDWQNFVTHRDAWMNVVTAPTMPGLRNCDGDANSEGEPQPVAVEPLKYYHFYHVYSDGRWRDACEEHLSALRTSGLLAHLEPIRIGIVGTPQNRQSVKDFFTNAGIAYEVCAESETGWEQVTQNKLHDFAVIDGYVLYAHTKGASDHSDRNISWRRTMTKHTVLGWREAAGSLREHHAAGCYWTGAFFAGTFWWTKLEHIRRLDKPGLSSRLDAEFWIGKIKGAKMIDLRKPLMRPRTKRAVVRLILKDVASDRPTA